MNEFLFSIIYTSHRKGTEQFALEPRDTETWEVEVALVPPSQPGIPFSRPQSHLHAKPGLGVGRKLEDPAALSSFLPSLGLTWDRWGDRVDSVSLGWPLGNLRGRPLSGLNVPHLPLVLGGGSCLYSPWAPTPAPSHFPLFLPSEGRLSPGPRGKPQFAPDMTH